MTTESKSKKLYRVLYRARLSDNSPIMGEFKLRTTKEKWEIDFETIADKYLKIAGTATFDEIINTEILT